MPKKNTELLTVNIGDQVLRIRADATERERYQRAEQMVNDILNQIRSGGALGPRTLAMALFQIAIELDEMQESIRNRDQMRERLNRIIKRLDEATESDIL